MTWGCFAVQGCKFEDIFVLICSSTTVKFKGSLIFPTFSSKTVFFHLFDELKISCRGSCWDQVNSTASINSSLSMLNP